MRKTIFLAIALATSACAEEVGLLFLGDTSFGENYFEWLEREGKENILKTKGYDHSLANFKNLLVDADFVIANLETPITNLKRAPRSHASKTYIHWTDVEHAPRTLKAHGVAAVSLANNHTLDFGLRGLEQTAAILDRHAIAYFGAGLDEARAKAPLQKRFALDGCAFEAVVFGRFEYILEYDRDYDFYSSSNKGGAAVLDPAELAISIGRIKSQRPRAFVVVFPHWGENYQWRSEEQARMGRALIDAGADLILGHGAHMIQEIERRRDGWIVYSIGNFVFNSLGRYGKGKEVLPVSFIAKLSAVVAESEVRLRLRLYPIFSDNRKTGFQPRFLTAREFGQALRMLRTKSAIAEPLRTGHDTHSPYLELDISRRLPCVD